MQLFLSVDFCVILRHVSTMRLSAFLLIVVCSVTYTDWIRAADRIWLEPARPTVGQGDWYPRSIESFTGSVVAFDAEQYQN